MSAVSNGTEMVRLVSEKQEKHAPLVSRTVGSKDEVNDEIYENGDAASTSSCQRNDRNEEREGSEPLSKNEKASGAEDYRFWAYVVRHLLRMLYILFLHPVQGTKKNDEQ